MGPTAMAGLGLNLHVIRERAWTILREKCSSFTAVDENAQFSQIFTKNVFSGLNHEQKSRLMSIHYFAGWCEHCVTPVSAELEVFVNYVTLSDTEKFDLPLSSWPELLRLNNCQNQIQCPSCDNNCDSQLFISNLATALFVEFSPGTMDVLNFQSEIRE